MKAKHGQIAGAQKAFAIGAHAECVGGIIYHLKSVTIRDALYRIDIAGRAVAMHRQDRRGAGGDGRLDLGRIQIAGNRIDIDEDRRQVVPEQRVGGCHE